MAANDLAIQGARASAAMVLTYFSRLCFYQTGSALSMDQGSTRKRSAVHNFAPTVTKFCVMWEGQALPHDTKFGNSRCEMVGRRVIFIWSLIHGSSWSGLIKVGPGIYWPQHQKGQWQFITLIDLNVSNDICIHVQSSIAGWSYKDIILLNIKNVYIHVCFKMRCVKVMKYSIWYHSPMNYEQHQHPVFTDSWVQKMQINSPR